MNAHEAMKMEKSNLTEAMAKYKKYTKTEENEELKSRCNNPNLNSNEAERNSLLIAERKRVIASLDEELNDKKNLLLGMKSEENIGIDKLKKQMSRRSIANY